LEDEKEARLAICIEEFFPRFTSHHSTLYASRHKYIDSLFHSFWTRLLFEAFKLKYSSNMLPGIGEFKLALT
jgi:hypothetical protein